MIKETLLNVDFLKAYSGKFDLEIVYVLNLQAKNITRLLALPKCKSLTFLNLSKNKLFAINGIEELTKLVYLDLSYSQLEIIEGLEKCKSLKTLKLQGNKVAYEGNVTGIYIGENI